MSTLNRFDWVAPYYDLIASIVFFGAVKKSQLFYLDKLSPGNKVLVLGGGTGWIIRELQRITPNLQIVYVEASRKMIELTKKKIEPGDVQLIHGTQDSLPSLPTFDVVITNYFLDVFTDEDLSGVISKIDSLLKSNGIWIVTDFSSDKWWHRLMLKVMYGFFRVTGSLNHSQLPAWKQQLKTAGLHQVNNKFFFDNFIQGVLFKKNS